MVSGPKPKAFNSDGVRPIRHRVQPVHEWTEVPNVRYDHRLTTPLNKKEWPARTRVWWNAVRQMPHCVLWDEGEWTFALDTATIHREFVRKPWDTRLSAELRRREDRMGTSADSRRTLRIRYVDQPTEEEVKEEEDEVDYGALV